MANSLNVPAVRALLLDGVQSFRDRLWDLGYTGLSSLCILLTGSRGSLIGLVLWFLILMMGDERIGGDADDGAVDAARTLDAAGDPVPPQVLVDGVHAAGVVVGGNFHFGHRAAGDTQTLRAPGQQQGESLTGYCHQ